LTAKISERSGGKDEYFAKRNEYQAQFDEFTRKNDDLMARKEQLNRGIIEKKQEGAEMRNHLSNMTKSSEAAIGDRMIKVPTLSSGSEPRR